MKRILLLLSFFCWAPVSLLLAQDNIPLKYAKDIPKDLFGNRNAVLINFITNKDLAPEEETQKFNDIKSKLLRDNQQLGLQLVHFANKNQLLQPAQKSRLLKQYDSLRVNNLFMLDITDFSAQGAQGSYVLLLTPYNHTPKLMSANQTAFTLQAESYEKLIRNLRSEIDQFKPAYFTKPPVKNPQSAATPTPATALPTTAPKKTGQPYKFPLISLTEEDAKRVYGGPHDNFYYYMGNSLEERNSGFFGQKLRKDLEASPDAVKELNKYRTLKYMYLAERALFITSLALYAEHVANAPGREYFSKPQQVYIGMAIGSLVINHILSRTTNKHMFRAIDEYNAFATTRNNTGFRWIKPDHFGLGSVNRSNPVPGASLTWNIR